MKNKFRNMSIIALALALAFASFTACGKEDEKPVKDDNKVIITTSSSAEGIINVLAEEYQKENSNITFEINVEDSDEALRLIRKGDADLGVMSRELTKDEKSMVDDAQAFAMDGIAVIANKDCPVDNLSGEQLRSIYTGDITNWSELGGEDKPITVYSREEGSGTRYAFGSQFGIFNSDDSGNVTDDTTEDVITCRSSDEIKTAIADDSTAIGYISYMALDKTVKTLALDGTAIDDEGVTSGDYKLTRNLIFVKPVERSDATDDFVDFVLSRDGQQIIEDEGWLPVK